MMFIALFGVVVAVGLCGFGVAVEVGRRRHEEQIRMSRGMD